MLFSALNCGDLDSYLSYASATIYLKFSNKVSGFLRCLLIEVIDDCRIFVSASSVAN